ncbi:MAG: hypothetical protein LBV43_05395 [Prevotella sp.]|nr:hypothetical protein [Prevotella sp.]
MGKEKELKRIAQYLLLHTSAISNIGLLHGKMGICIFFFYYARHTKKEVYKMYAEDLLDEIYSEINTNVPANFSNGLYGIGWGIRYLSENKFVKVNSDIVLKTLDQAVLERDIRRVTDSSLDTGLKGITYYILSRCADEDSVFAKTNFRYLNDLLSTLKSVKTDEEMTALISSLERFISEGKLPKFDLFLRKMIKNTRVSKWDIWESPRPVGIINNGFAGIGLRMLNVI